MKNKYNFLLPCIILVSAALFMGCNAGMFLGTSGELVIIDKTATNVLNNQFIEVDANNGTVTLGFNPARKQMKGTVLSAPLVTKPGNKRYSESDTFTASQFTVNVYASKNESDTTASVPSKTFPVTFREGAFLINWN